MNSKSGLEALFFTSFNYKVFIANISERLVLLCDPHSARNPNIIPKSAFLCLVVNDRRVHISVKYMHIIHMHPSGSNHRWLTPGIYLREVRGDIASLLEDLIDAIDTASKSPAQVSMML